MSARDPRGLRVLVTGASGTFGRAICARLDELGAQVVGLDLAPRADDPVRLLACDITDDDAVPAVVREAIDQLGGLDLLINNAGIGGPAPAELAPGAEVRRQLDINLLGTWRVTAACVDALVASGGRIVMLSSRMAVMQLPLAAAYGASKRDVDGPELDGVVDLHRQQPVEDVLPLPRVRHEPCGDRVGYDGVDE
ncbi:SDR family NAD(P)-dependent oxidoreductase [Micromonospora lutea]|uniref:SDR family NAD(P)-dependent oxidoreductase n=1 Tax=Micromonospora lutea TaxID=419825 RepID=A0ABQ4IY55_9ACTN|nr:SDR family NAD(P)-dependent oxidoreductase [Micromonospora lutea]GIJ22853.1 hypothetical protein Vlu01_34770 [Micromonospora lutea]